MVDTEIIGIPPVIVNAQGEAQCGNWGIYPRIVILECVTSGGVAISSWNKSIVKGDNPVCQLQSFMYGAHSGSHVPWDWCRKWVVAFVKNMLTHLRPIVHKYHEGKVN